MKEINLEADFAHLADLRGAAETYGLECVPVQDAGMAMAFAVPFSLEEGTAISMVSFMIGKPEMVYITGGVALQPGGDRLTLLEALNHQASENPIFAPFVHGGLGDVLIQTKLRAEVFLKFPPLFELLIRTVPEVLVRIRAALGIAGASGPFYAWSGENLQRLSIHSIM